MKTKVDLQDIIADLEEAKGFAAMSPAGRNNIASALDGLEDAAKETYRKGFVDGENHADERLKLILDGLVEESIRRMNQPQILGFDAEGFPNDNPEYLPHSDTQIGVEFAESYLREKLKTPAVFPIGDETMVKFLKPNGIENVSNLQAVFDSVKTALIEAFKVGA